MRYSVSKGAFWSRVALTCIFTAAGCSATTEETPAQGSDLQESDLITFERCVEIGGVVLKTMPPSCMIGGRQVFAKPVKAQQMPKEQDDQKKLCIDYCGDGICAEVVCQGEGCPCLETPQSCPEDC